MIQNIRLIHPNMARTGGYFYSIDNNTNNLIQKTDDGTLAFSYPLDTPVGSEVKCLQFDGQSWWSLEWINAGAENQGFRIRRWLIQNFVLVLQQTFNYPSNATDTFNVQSFAIENYPNTLAAGAGSGATSIFVNYDATRYGFLSPGTRLFLGPSVSSGNSEQAIVASLGPGGNQVQLTAPLVNSYSTNDPITFSNHIWFFSDNFLTQLGIGGLYKAAIADGSIISRTSGGAFIQVFASGFTIVSSFVGALATHNKPFLIFMRTNSLLFSDVAQPNYFTELSAIQNNLASNTTTVNTVYALGINGNTIFRLQLAFNINGTDSTETTFNYQLSTFKPFPTAIALTAVEAVLPASSGAATSTVTATVTDQYLLPFNRPASTITFTTSGGGAGSGLAPTGAITLNAQGQAQVIYTTGNTAGLVTITATVVAGP